MTVPKSPQITFDAREALREIQTGISSIDNKLTWLSEPSLKGLRMNPDRTPRVTWTDRSGSLWRRPPIVIMSFLSDAALDEALGMEEQRAT